MKNWVKKNWFKLGILILGTIFIIGSLFIQMKEARIKKYQAEQSAINWAWSDQNAINIVGQKEKDNFKKHFWNLFDY